MCVAVKKPRASSFQSPRAWLYMLCLPLSKYASLRLYLPPASLRFSIYFSLYIYVRASRYLSVSFSYVPQLSLYIYVSLCVSLRLSVFLYVILHVSLCVLISAALS